GFLSRAESGLSAVLLEQNDVSEALRYAHSGVAKTLHWQSANHVAWAHIFLARALMATGDLAGAAASLEGADEARRKLPVLPIISNLLEATWVRVWLAQGNLLPAERWANKLPSATAGHNTQAGVITENSELLLVAQSRVLIARGRAHGDNAALDEALALLARLKTAALNSGRLNTLIEVLVLEAVARYHHSTLLDGGEAHPKPELDALEQALQLGEQEGYIRVFIDEGDVMQRLLTMLGRQSMHVLPPHQRAYLARLLQAFPASPSTSDLAPAAARPAEGLIEPLSERELEIVRLIAAGMNTRAIAGKLIVAPGTVKAHLASIYRKLDVHSRTQALATARVLGLLD
ncbi:MAG TPA: LuxR C-terminal-related transcriptional regulator, partial [Anaerolineae bacterium]